MRHVVKIDDNTYEVTKEFAMLMVEEQLADWLVATEDFKYGGDEIAKGERYIILADGSLYHEDDDPSDLVELVGYQVELVDDSGQGSTPYYDKEEMQWIM